MTDSLSLEDLLSWFSRGHREEKDFCLGLEYEMFLTNSKGAPLPYEGPSGVEELLAAFAERTGWKLKSEAGRIFGLDGGDGRNLSLEPGAQVEFNSSPCASLVDLEREFQEMLGHFRALTEDSQVLFLGLGAHPVASPSEIKRIPKARYDILEPWLTEAGELGLWMMKATCGTQVNFDHSGPRDAAKKLRVALGLAPVLNALFANSSIRAGQPSGYASWRGHVWSKTDPSRCGWIPPCVQETSSLEDYANWALDVPMLFIEREHGLVDMRGQRFREYWMSGKATLEDWDLHLSTLFPEARLRPQIELRSIDGGCPLMALALCALVKGIFYSEQALDAAWALVSDWSDEERDRTWHEAHLHGLSGIAPCGNPLRKLANALLDKAELSPEETPYLNPLKKILEGGYSEGELTLQLWEKDWGGDMSRLLQSANWFH